MPDFLGQPGRLLLYAHVAKKAVQVVKPGPGEDALVADMAKLSREVLQQLNLHRVSRSEVAVPTFAGDRPPHFSVPEQPRFAQSGAGGNHRRVGVRVGGSLLEQVEVLGLKGIDAPGARLDVVEQTDAAH